MAGVPIYRVKVAFENEQINKYVVTDDTGAYKAELPFGDYTMTAQAFGYRPYRRPLFRVMASREVNFDATLRKFADCDVQVFDRGKMVTPQDWAAAQSASCLREDFLPMRLGGSPFQLSIRYGTRTVEGDGYSYFGENHGPVFIAYNLFSMQADEIVFDSKAQTLEALGNIVVVNEPSTVQRANHLSFHLKDGSAIETNPVATFHVKGTITALDSVAVLPKAKVSFHGQYMDKSILGNERGVYDVDLPLGEYRMSAEGLGVRLANHPFVHADIPKTVTVNAIAYPARLTCDIVVINKDGSPVTEEERIEGGKNECGGEDSFFISTQSDESSKLHFEYTKRTSKADSYIYTADRLTSSNFLTPVFVEYKDLTLQADQIIYDRKNNTIQASGHVSLGSESIPVRHANSMNLRIEDGRVVPVQ